MRLVLAKFLYYFDLKAGMIILGGLIRQFLCLVQRLAEGQVASRA